MSRLKKVAAALAVVFSLGIVASAAQAADVDVKTKAGIPVGVIVTLSHKEAQAVGKGQRLDIPGVPAKFEKPLRKLAAKIKATDQGKGVKVSLTVKVFPPGIKDKVEAR